eukprot:1138913-Pelagomonas_calceolata.AAC.6
MLVLSGTCHFLAFRDVLCASELGLKAVGICLPFSWCSISCNDGLESIDSVRLDMLNVGHCAILGSVAVPSAAKVPQS